MSTHHLIIAMTAAAAMTVAGAVSADRAQLEDVEKAYRAAEAAARDAPEAGARGGAQSCDSSRSRRSFASGGRLVGAAAAAA